VLTEQLSAVDLFLVLFTTTEAYSLITAGHPRSVKVIVLTFGRSHTGSVLGRCDPDETFEGSREMALVTETRSQRNISQGGFGVSQIFASALYPQTANVISDGTLVRAMKYLRQIYRMNTNLPGNIC
jgi:hypothetical protein